MSTKQFQWVSTEHLLISSKWQWYLLQHIVCCSHIALFTDLGIGGSLNVGAPGCSPVSTPLNPPLTVTHHQIKPKITNTAFHNSCIFATFHIVHLSQQRMECIIKIKGWKSRQHVLQSKHDVKTVLPILRFSGEFGLVFLWICRFFWRLAGCLFFGLFWLKFACFLGLFFAGFCIVDCFFVKFHDHFALSICRKTKFWHVFV